MGRRRTKEEEGGSGGAGFTRTDKPKPSKADIHAANRRALEARAEVAKLRAPEGSIDVFIDDEGPHIILFLSDIHYGSDTVDYALLDEVVEFVESHSNAYVVCLGDMIEGSKPEYRTIEAHRTGSVTGEIQDFQQHVLERIGDRVLGAVGHFFGHPGWSQDSGGTDPWNEMFDEYGIPVVKNASTINISYPGTDGDTNDVQLDVAHYFQGKSRVDSLHAQREHTKRKKGDKKPDVTASGHTHQKAQAIEWYPGAPIPAILMQSGTFKGINPDLPEDPFASKGGFDTGPGGPGQMLHLTKKGRIYRSIDLNQGEVINSAISLVENNPSIAEEAIEMANAHSKPEITFRSRRSLASIDREHLLSEEEQIAMMSEVDGEEADEDLEPNGIVYSQSDLAPLYDKVSYNIRSDWPILFLPFANVRMGSSYEGTATLRKMIEELVLENPHVMVAFLGNVVDTDVSRQENRVAILDELAGLINLIGSEQVLALLLDSSLRNANWRKDIGETEYVPPGTYVSEQTGVPLVPGGSSIEIFHGSKSRSDRNDRHSIMLLDGLKRHGSYSKALMGLTSYDHHHNHAGHDVLVSGHHPHAAVGTYEKDGRIVDLMDVGWLSPFDNASGKKNVGRTARGGQGLIINEGMRIPTGDWGETVELFNAIFALTAARKFGMIDTK
jgi:hypothetical protein